MATIWKYALAVEDEQTIHMPDGAKMLHVAAQHGKVCVWALVNPEARKTKRSLRIYGTGHDMPADPGRYLGTFMVSGGSLVFHVFEPR